MDLYKDFQAASVLMQARCFILTPKGGRRGISASLRDAEIMLYPV
jgi:hypothetical protein